MEAELSAPVPLETKREFLAALAETGNVLETCRRTGVNRATAYHWRGDPEFDRMWGEALHIQRDAIRDELVAKAMAATGHVVEERQTDDRGEPVLDDDFEPVVVRRLVGHDSNVLRTLLNKLVRSEDAPAATSVSVSNVVSVEAPPRPCLVTPDAVDAEFEEVDGGV